jgi:hypothetical protein
MVSPYTRDDGRKKNNTDRVKNLSLYHCILFFHRSPFVACFDQNKAEVKFVPSSKPHRPIQKITVLPRTHKSRLHFNPMYLNWNVLITNKGRSSFPNAKRHGQLQISQSVPVCAFCPQLVVIVMVAIYTISFNGLFS